MRVVPPAHSPITVGALLASLRKDPSALQGLADILGSRLRAGDVILCGSGTQALELALRWIVRRDSRRRVAVPAFSCYSVATAVVGADAVAVPYDLDPGTLAPDFDSLDAACGTGVAAMIVSPLYGVPIAWDMVEELSRRHGVTVIEDAAQGSGASWRDKPLGALGDLSVLSFGRGKGWTGGAGGALLSREHLELEVEGGAGSLATLAVPVRLGLQLAFGRPQVYGIPASIPLIRLGETIYHDPAPLRGLPAGAASALLQTLTLAEDEAGVRRRRADRLISLLQALHEGLTPIVAPSGGLSGYLRLPVRWPASRSGGKAPGHRFGAAWSYPVPLPHLPALARRLDGGMRTWPGACELARHLLTLPTHSLMTDRDVDGLLRELSLRLHPVDMPASS